jgi:hypothetical protein
MKNVGSRTVISVGVFAVAMSMVCAFFIPYGYPWPSLAWGVLACAAAGWLAMSSIRSSPLMSDVIGDVEAESPRIAAAPKRGVAPTTSVS